MFIKFIFAAASLISSAYAEDTIKIGYLPALTGSFAADSVNEIKMVKLATKQINAAGGALGKKIELVMVDSKSTPQGALEAFNQLVEKEKVSGILTNSKSVQIVALAVASKQAKIAVIIGGSSPKLTDDPENMFIRMRPDDDIMAAGAVQYIKESTSFKKVGIVHDSAINGSSMANQQEKYLKSSGGLQMVARAAYATGATDLSDQFGSMNKAGAEIVFGNPAVAQDGAKMYMAAKKYAKEFQYFGTPGAGRATAIQGAGPAANGALVMAEYVPGTEVLKKLSEAYQAEYKEEFDPFTLWIYDGFNVLVEGLKFAGGDPKLVKASIVKKRQIPGVMRTFDFDQRGDGHRSIIVTRVENGQLVPVRTVDVVKK